MVFVATRKLSPRLSRLQKGLPMNMEKWLFSCQMVVLFTQYHLPAPRPLLSFPLNSLLHSFVMKDVNTYQRFPHLRHQIVTYFKCFLFIFENTEPSACLNEVKKLKYYCNNFLQVGIGWVNNCIETDRFVSKLEQNVIISRVEDKLLHPKIIME